MTKAEHKQRAMDMAYQVKHRQGKAETMKVASRCLEALRKSLKGI